MAYPSSQAAMLLMRQLNELKKNTDSGFSAGLVDESNPFEWQVILTGPPDTWYDGGLFKAKLSFPRDYPYMPPTMRFTSEMWHPNIYKDGKVCISILHAPGSDPNQYENASERWLPVHTVESILVSVISMLASPNDESPANLDAAKEWRETPDLFKKKVRDTVRRAQEDCPYMRPAIPNTQLSKFELKILPKFFQSCNERIMKSRWPNIVHDSSVFVALRGGS